MPAGASVKWLWIDSRKKNKDPKKTDFYICSFSMTVETQMTLKNLSKN